MIFVSCTMANTTIVNQDDFLVGIFSPQQFNVSGNYVWIQTSSTYGCDPYQENVTVTQNKICLVQRGICTFVEKTIFAQDANCSMIVVYADGGDLIYMSGDSCGITIPAVFMTDLQKYTKSPNNTLWFEFDGHYYPNLCDMLIIFGTVGAVICVIVILVCVRRIRNNTSPINIENYVIPIQGSIDGCCAICQECETDEDNEKTQLLSDNKFVKLKYCAHVFHKKCIGQSFDKWDQKCPVCRAKVDVSQV